MSDFADQFQSLHVDRSSGHVKPHKAVLLLAVIDTIEAAGEEAANRFEFGEALREPFTGYFELVRRGNDQANAILPFFHMKTEDFWRLRVQPGYEKTLEVMKHPGGARQLTEAVQHAELDPALFDLLRDPAQRKKLREALVSRWFPERADAVWRRIELEGRAGAYGRRIESLAEEGCDAAHVWEEAPEQEVRDTAFRRVVTEAYDYRCTACGLRLVHEGRSIVEACHLIPWSESHDDDPRNGLALCRNHHWAMDRHLIAPGPDMIWHASRNLDKRIDGERRLLEIRGQPVIKPVRERFGPKAVGLDYRVARLA